MLNECKYNNVKINDTKIYLNVPIFKNKNVITFKYNHMKKYHKCQNLKTLFSPYKYLESRSFRGQIYKSLKIINNLFTFKYNHQKKFQKGKNSQTKFSHYKISRIQKLSASRRPQTPCQKLTPPLTSNSGSAPAGWRWLKLFDDIVEDRSLTSHTELYVVNIADDRGKGYVITIEDCRRAVY